MEKVETAGIVVDTDIIIDYLRKRQPGSELFKKAYLEHRIYVTSITVYELLYGVQKSRKDNLINRLLKYVRVVPLDETAGTLHPYRFSKDPEHKRPLSHP